MSKPTPPIPDRFRAFRAQPQFTSIFEVYPTESRLYGTEDWHGDWDGRALIMAKDAGSSRIFRPRAEGGRGWAWITDRSRPTNRNLEPLLAGLPGGKLYASFLGPLLRNDDRESGSLPAHPEIDAFVNDVFRWTIGEMKKLQFVAVLGGEAWVAITRAAGVPETKSDWKDRHRSGAPLGANVCNRQLHLIALNHPARIPSRVLINQPGWRWLLEQYGLSTESAVRQPPRSTASSTASSASTFSKNVGGDWTRLVPREVKAQRPAGIRAAMLEILRAAGTEGASVGAFTHLEWRDRFRADKLRVAMGLLSGETGLKIQQQDHLNDESLAKYRIEP